MINGGEISGNNSQYGGGICVDDTAIFTMNGGTISSNQAVQGGGVYPLGKDTTCEFNAGNINKNQATFGGGIFNSSAQTKIGAITIAENIGTNKGGGIYLFRPCTIDKTIISKNLSRDGGGICQRVAEDTTQIIRDMNFNENHGIHMGGGIIVERGTLQIDDSTFTNNIAENEEFLTLEEKNASPENTNRRGSGGGIYVRYLADDATKLEKEPTKLVVNNTTFSGNKAYYGGGIWTANDTDISNSIFEQNSAYVIQDDNKDKQNQGHGGAIYVNTSMPKGKIVNINKSTFVENSADKSGGAISIDETYGFIQISNGTKFERNYTIGKFGNGGAIYSNLHSYKATYDDGSQGPIDPEPNPNIYYINLRTDETTTFIGNKSFRTFTPPKNKKDFSNLLFASTTHMGTKYDHILNNDDVNINMFKKVTFYKTDETTDSIYEINIFLEGDTFGDNLPSDPVRTGYEFKEWNKSKDGNGKKLTKEQIKNLKINENIDLYAIYTKKKEVINEAPIIETKDVTIIQGTDFDLKKLIIKAMDKEDGNLITSVKMIDDGDFDKNKIGVYKITFQVEDSNGIVVKAIAKVYVIENKTILNPKQPIDHSNSSTTKIKMEKVPQTSAMEHFALYGIILLLSIIGIYQSKKVGHIR